MESKLPSLELRGNQICACGTPCVYNSRSPTVIITHLHVLAYNEELVKYLVWRWAKGPAQH